MVKLYLKQAWELLKQNKLFSLLYIYFNLVRCVKDFDGVESVAPDSIINYFSCITLGIYLPARNISRIPPTAALRDE